MFAGCKKEGTGDRFKIVAEQYSGIDKVIIDGLSASWAVGDAICVNNTTGTVTAVSNNSATLVTNESVNSPYYAVYPASMVAEGTDLSAGGTVVVSLPDSYEYLADPSTGKQILQIPMAATSTTESLTFKHLTGALAVNVTNSFSGGVTMDIVDVAVISNSYRLNGNYTVDFTNLTSSTPVVSNVNDEKKVRMTFPTPLTVANGSTANIMIPVAAVGNDNKFTIHVKVATPDGKAYLFMREQSITSGLSRNEVGAVPVFMEAGNSDNYIHQSFLGNGTQSNPYLISNWNDYKLFEKIIGLNVSSNPHRAMYANAYYLMTNDIDATSNFTSYSNGRGEFGGHFDGDNHTFNNVVVVPSGYTTTAGLYCFPMINGGTVENLTMNVTFSPRHSTATSGTLYLSGLTHKIQNGTVNNVTVTMQMDDSRTLNAKGTAYIAGLAAANDCYNVTVSNCTINVPNITYSGYHIYFGGLFSFVNTSSHSNVVALSNNVVNLGNISLTSSNNKKLYFGGVAGQINGDNYTLTDNTITITDASLELSGTVGTSSEFYVAGAFGYTNANRKTIAFNESNVLSGSITYNVPTDVTKKGIKKVINKISSPANTTINDGTTTLTQTGDGTHVTVSNLNFYDDASSTPTTPVDTDNY